MNWAQIRNRNPELVVYPKFVTIRHWLSPIFGNSHEKRSGPQAYSNPAPQLGGYAINFLLMASKIAVVGGKTLAKKTLYWRESARNFNGGDISPARAIIRGTSPSKLQNGRCFRAQRASILDNCQSNMAAGRNGAKRRSERFGCVRPSSPSSLA